MQSLRGCCTGSVFSMVCRGLSNAIPMSTLNKPYWFSIVTIPACIYSSDVFPQFEIQYWTFKSDLMFHHRKKDTTRCLLLDLIDVPESESPCVLSIPFSRHQDEHHGETMDTLTTLNTNDIIILTFAQALFLIWWQFEVWNVKSIIIYNIEFCHGLKLVRSHVLNWCAFVNDWW